MKRRIRGTLLAICSFLLIIAAAPAAFPGASHAAASNPGSRPLLNGTFIQLLDENGNWSRTRWERLFDSLHSLGLTRVVVQWSHLDGSAFYPAESSARNPVETILQLAEARGLDVYLGLAAESRYWEMIKQPPARQEEYLKRLRLKSLKVARDLAPLASGYSAFRGWYIPEEIDDLSWRAPKPRKVLFRHVEQLSTTLKRLTPGKEVALSAFCNARMDPGSYGEFWRDLLGQSSVDLLLFQDGAGVGKLPRELLPVYLKELRSATDAANRKLQVVVELFEMVSESPFQAKAAPIQRVIGQLEVAGRFASGGIVAFSVPDYMSFDGGAAAKELLDGYVRYRQGEKPWR